MATVRRIVRRADGTEEVWTPYRDKDGHYVLATKQTADPINYASNKVLVESLDDAVAKLRTGEYQIRMSCGAGEANLISADSLEILE